MSLYKALLGHCCQQTLPSLLKGLLPLNLSHGMTMSLESKSWRDTLSEVASFVCLIFVWGTAQLNNCSHHVLLRCVCLRKVPRRVCRLFYHNGMGWGQQRFPSHPPHEAFLGHRCHTLCPELDPTELNLPVNSAQMWVILTKY